MKILSLGQLALEEKDCTEKCQKSTAQVPGQELRALGDKSFREAPSCFLTG